MFDTILFDLDGTISDSAPGITRCVAYALEKFDIKTGNLSSLTWFVGPPLRDSFAKLGFDSEQVEQAVAFYRERYEPIGVYETEAYPGVREMIRFLHEKGKTLALATSKPTVFAKVVLDDYGIANCFDFVLGCELDGRRDDKAEIMAECLAALGIEGEKKSRAIMVGDRNYDINGAKANGINSVAVTYGYAPEGELQAAKPDHIVNNTEELQKLLLSE